MLVNHIAQDYYYAIAHVRTHYATSMRVRFIGATFEINENNRMEIISQTNQDYKQEQIYLILGFK